MNFAPQIFASILYFSSWRNHSEVNRKNFCSSTKQQRPSFLYEDRNLKLYGGGGGGGGQ